MGSLSSRLRVMAIVLLILAAAIILMAVGTLHAATALPPPDHLVPAPQTVLPPETPNIILSWNAVPGAATYSVQVIDWVDLSARDPRSNCAGNPERYLCLNGLTATSITLPVRTDYTYSFVVQAVSGTTRSSGAWSNFAVGSVPIPVMRDPLTGRSFPSDTRDVTLTWDAIVPATGYAVRVKDLTDTNVRDPRNNCPSQPDLYLCVNEVASTTFTVPVMPGHTYAWWVQARRGPFWSLAQAVHFKVNDLGTAQNNAQVLAQTIPARMEAGQGYPVIVTVKNTGRSTWTQKGGYRLGSQSPRDNRNWGFGRVELGAGEAVAPGQTKTFAFTVTAPASPGLYYCHWQMVQETKEWIGTPSAPVLVEVVARKPYWAQFTGHTMPPTLVAGERRTVQLTLQNTGTVTWANTAVQQFRLGARPLTQRVWGVNAVWLSSTDAVAPGQSKTFTLNVTAPTKPGLYNFSWVMLRIFCEDPSSAGALSLGAREDASYLESPEALAADADSLTSAFACSGGQVIASRPVGEDTPPTIIRVLPAAVDTQPPTIELTSPAAGMTVTGVVTVSARAFDYVGVTKVEFAVDGQKQWEDAAAPYTMAWDTTAVAEGAHTLTVAAYDAAGHRSTANISINVARGSPRPNVIVFMTDDQDDVGSMDVMAHVRRIFGEEGVTFTNSVVAYSLCCPSRATFLTGQYAHNHGVTQVGGPDGGYAKLDHTNTLPVWLQRTGYYTGHIGKYLNLYGWFESQDTTPDDPFPANLEVPPGWTNWQGSVDPTTYWMYNYTLNENGTLVQRGETPEHYQTDVYTQKAVQFIRERAGERTPFFLSVAVLAPHTSRLFPGDVDPDYRKVLPAPRHIGFYARRDVPRPPSFNEADVSDKPSHMRRLPSLGSRQVSMIERYYRSRLEALLAVDEAVQEIVRALKQTGQWERTVFIFTSDNGMMHGQHRIPAAHKVYPYEESIRVPLLMAMPGLPSGQGAVRQISQVVGNVSLAPTIAEFTGATPGLAMDGRSLVPLLKGEATPSYPDILVEWWAASWMGRFLPTFAAVRTNQHVYIQYEPPEAAVEEELYDLQRDPYQLESVHNHSDYQRLKTELHDRLNVLRACTGESCW